MSRGKAGDKDDGPGLFDEDGGVAVDEKPVKKSEKPDSEPDVKEDAPAPRKTAEKMAEGQRQISVAEFFAKNRHLLGFDNPSKALLTTIKEAVDNALDACEEAGILPDISVEIHDLKDARYRVVVEDNGPGIVKEQMARIFGSLLYGSKFHRLCQSRGQQGIGISAAAMYGQMTTGKPALVTSRPKPRAQAHRMALMLDTKTNKAEVTTDEVVEWRKGTGTRVEIELEGNYKRGARSVDSYLKQTAVANPHVRLEYTDPSGEKTLYKRAVRDVPPEPMEIQPHPHGVELGRLMQMLKDTSSQRVTSFLSSEFSRVGAKLAKRIVEAAAKHDSSITLKTHPKRVARKQADALHKAIGETKIPSPPTNCLAPIGADALKAGLKKEVDADFFAAVSRPPSVYRGNPFLIEVAIAYGRPQSEEIEVADSGHMKKVKKAKKTDAAELIGSSEEQARVMRLANRVPLQYQQAACAITKAAVQTNWRSYGLSQPKGGLPVGSLAICVHIASVWVPFTSESKEAVASYPEILKELRLALQVCGRELGRHVKKKKKIQREYDKREFIGQYLPVVIEALQELNGFDDKRAKKLTATLTDVLERSRKF